MKALNPIELKSSTRFFEEKDTSAMNMTLNAYRSFYNAYLKQKQLHPNAPNEVAYFSRTISPIERDRRRLERIGFADQLGFDFGAARRELDSRFETLGPEIRAHIESGYKKGLDAPKQPLTPHSSKLLFLRARAFVKGRFCDLDMTPDDLKKITPEFCPILGTRLVNMMSDELHHDERHQWSVERMCNSLGYAKENIAVISTAANQARNNLNAEEILERAAGVVIDDQLTQIQWCRLFNHHFASLRLENPYIRKLDPPITWKPPRFFEGDIRQLTHAIANPYEPGLTRIDAPAELIAEYFRKAGKKEGESLYLAKRFKSECAYIEDRCSGPTDVNLISVGINDFNRQMLEELAKEVFGLDYREQIKDLGDMDRKLISKASSAGYSCKF